MSTVFQKIFTIIFPPPKGEGKSRIYNMINNNARMHTHAHANIILIKILRARGGGEYNVLLYTGRGQYNVLLYAKAIRRHAHCFKRKQKPPFGGAYCLGLDFGCFSIVFVKHFNFAV